jgi:hypothetical protein
MLPYATHVQCQFDENRLTIRANVSNLGQDNASATVYMQYTPN